MMVLIVSSTVIVGLLVVAADASIIGQKSLG